MPAGRRSSPNRRAAARSSSAGLSQGSARPYRNGIARDQRAYPGEATAETFNSTGKTDILIRHQGHNIFVAECKFWDGYEELKKTANQLLGYTTWRDTRTALIIFSRRSDFTNVINEAQRAMKDHPKYKNGPIGNEGESRFRYIFRHPDDDQRDIIVTLMLFNMPKPATR